MSRSGRRRVKKLGEELFRAELIWRKMTYETKRKLFSTY